VSCGIVMQPKSIPMKKLSRRIFGNQNQVLFPIVAPITETTEIKPPIRRIRGSCVRTYTNAVKATNAERPATLINAALAPGPTVTTWLGLSVLAAISLFPQTSEILRILMKRRFQ